MKTANVSCSSQSGSGRETPRAAICKDGGNFDWAREFPAIKRVVSFILLCAAVAGTMSVCASFNGKAPPIYAAGASTLSDCSGQEGYPDCRPK